MSMSIHCSATTFLLLCPQTDKPAMASLVEFKPRSDNDSDAGSDISKEDAEITTALLGMRPPLGKPEITRRFWFSKTRPNPGEDVATQVGVLYQDIDAST